MPFLTTAVPLDTVGERVLYGLQVTLIGLGFVFAVLLMIMGVIYLFRLFFYTIPNRKKKSDTLEIPIPASVSVPPIPVSVSPPSHPEEEVAVVAAALAAYLDQTPEVFASRYRIRSFKRIL